MFNKIFHIKFPSNAQEWVTKIAGFCVVLLLLYSFLVEPTWYAEGVVIDNHFVGFLIALLFSIVYILAGRMVSFTGYLILFSICFLVKFGFTRSLKEIYVSLIVAAVVRYILHKRI